MLFSFLIITYNQEKYVADALESALRQDYDELEVVVSDDHSSDRTFEIVKKIASEYRGPFKIILNRNERNLGIGCNFYKAYTLSHGEWLFMAAGDDISYPDRCQTVRSIVDRNPKCLAVGAIRDVIDGNNNHLGYSLWHEVIHGASAAWHRSLFCRFPPIESGNMSEDIVLFFRVFLLDGEAINIFRPLIRYRIDGNSISNKKSNNIVDFKRDKLKKALFYKKIIHNYFSDLEICRNNLIDCDYNRFLALLKNEYAKNIHNIQIFRIFIDTCELSFAKRIVTLLFDKRLRLKQRVLILIVTTPGLSFLYKHFVFSKQSIIQNNFVKNYNESAIDIISKSDFLEKKYIL